MVSLVWFILSLLGVCRFSWWPVLIESILAYIYGLIGNVDGGNNGAVIILLIGSGFMPFAVYKLFCGLTLSPWWLLAAPFWNIIALAFPGGYTISGILLEKYGLMTMPTWVLVVSVILDAVYLLLPIVAIRDWWRERKERSQTH